LTGKRVYATVIDNLAYYKK